MKLLKFSKVVIGNNNYIEKGVTIHKNVRIGDNNKIYAGTVIYPNTNIKNNNVILNGNVIGEHPVESKDNFKDKVFKGVEIGNDNFFHVKNLIFNGYYRKTVINDNNKILAECHIGHDTVINNNVTLYPRTITGGITTLMDHSSCGLNSIIQQRCVLGKYSMIGMNNVASHNVFPYFIYFNQKYVRYNKMKIPSDLLIHLEHHSEEIGKLIDDLKNNDCDKELIHKYNFSDEIVGDIGEFLNTITIGKI